MVSMTWSGGDALVKSLRDLPERVRGRVLVSALKEAGEPMRAEMARLAPRGPDAPHIAENIVMSTVSSVDGVRVDSATEAAVAIGPATRYFYGSFWEYGWSKHPVAHPFVRPAFDKGAASALVSIGHALWQAIIRAGGGSSRSSTGGGL